MIGAVTERRCGRCFTNSSLPSSPLAILIHPERWRSWTTCTTDTGAWTMTAGSTRAYDRRELSSSWTARTMRVLYESCAD